VGKAAEKRAVHGKRRRMQGAHGMLLMKPYTGRSCALMYDTGAMRQPHLRGREHIRKLPLIHAIAINLSLAFRELFQVGTP
jgi:hypothetical protein